MDEESGERLETAECFDERDCLSASGKGDKVTLLQYLNVGLRL